MKKTVTSAYMDAWRAKSAKKGFFKIQYLRRYWTGAAYVYEDTWQELPLSKHCEIGPITFKLDTPFLNTIRSSNVTLYLNNAHHNWIPNNNTNGIFAADSATALGYEPYLTKFKIYQGYELADGTVEYVALFTGVAIDYIFGSSSGRVEVVVAGFEQFLLIADAQKVSDAFTNEACSPATGDGTNKNFVSTSKGVHYISRIRTATTVKTQGGEYSIGATNQYDTPASIAFAVAPANGAAVDSSGRRWKVDQKIETLIGLLCDQAGITAGNRVIDPVLFPGGVSGSHTWDTLAEWAAGTHVNTSSASVENSLALKWLKVTAYNLTFPFSLVGTVSSGSARNIPMTKVLGTWRWKGQVTGTPSGNTGYWFISQNNVPGSETGYGIVFTASSVLLVRGDNGVRTTLATLTGSLPSGYHEYRVTSNGAGELKVYYDGSLLATVSDAMYLESTYFTCVASLGGGTKTVYTDELYISGTLDGTSTFDGLADSVYESAEVDLLATPTALGLLEKTENLNGGTARYYTACSATSGSGYEAFREISGSGQQNSTPGRYCKIQVAITQASTGYTYLETSVSRVKINFTMNTVNVSLANFAGKSCFAAIQRLAQIADYIWGFTADGIFFFRSKTVTGSPHLIINQGDGLAEVVSMRLGYDNITNVGQVTYNGYYNEYDGTAASESTPTSEQRYGAQVLQEDLSDILLANDVNLGAARAQSIYENNHLARREVKLRTKFLGFSELLDIFQASFFDNPVFKANLFGDPAIPFGSPELAFGQNENVLLRDCVGKVIGITHNPSTMQTETDLLEIL